MWVLWLRTTRIIINIYVDIRFIGGKTNKIEMEVYGFHYVDDESENVYSVLHSPEPIQNNNRWQCSFIQNI